MVRATSATRTLRSRGRASSRVRTTTGRRPSCSSSSQATSPRAIKTLRGSLRARWRAPRRLRSLRDPQTRPTRRGVLVPGRVGRAAASASASVSSSTRRCSFWRGVIATKCTAGPEPAPAGTPVPAPTACTFAAVGNAARPCWRRSPSPRRTSCNPCRCLIAQGAAVRRRPWPASTRAIRRATRACATHPTRRRSRRSSRSCAPLVMTSTVSGSGA